MTLDSVLITRDQRELVVFEDGRQQYRGERVNSICAALEVGVVVTCNAEGAAPVFCIPRQYLALFA